MQTDFLASGKNFLPFFETAVNCCQWKVVFSSTGTYFSAKSSFWPVKTRFLSIGKSISMFLYSIFLYSANVKYYWNLGKVKF